MSRGNDDLHLPEGYIVYPSHGLGWTSWTWLYSAKRTGLVYMRRGYDTPDKAANGAWDHWINAIREAQ